MPHVMRNGGGAPATACAPIAAATAGSKRHLLSASRARARWHRHLLLVAAAAAAAAAFTTTPAYADEGADAAPPVKIITKEELAR